MVTYLQTCQALIQENLETNSTRGSEILLFLSDQN